MSAKKQRKITESLIGRSLHAIDELDIPYALIIQDCPKVFSNVNLAHANAIIARQARLIVRVEELEAEDAAYKLTAIPPEEDGQVAA